MNSLLIAGNILKRAFRKKRELLILTLLPIIIIAAMTIISNQNSLQITDIGYVNLDNSFLSNILGDHLNNQEDLNVIAVSGEEKESALDKNKVSLLINIPENFTELIQQNQKVNVIMSYKESDHIYENIKQRINQYMISLYAINDLGNSSMVQDFTNRLNFPEITVDYHIAGINPGQEDYQGQLSSMGFVITFIMMLIFISTGNLLEDKKRLTLARIFSFPVRGWEVVVGNLLGSLVLGMMQLIPILIVLKIVFEIPWGLHFLGLALTLFAFLLTTIGLGVGLAGILKSNFNPFLLIATVIIPSSVLGGAFIPSFMMPNIMNKIGYIVPQKWVMDSLEKMLQGSSLNTIFFNLGIILMFGLAFATFGIKTLKPLND